MNIIITGAGGFVGQELARFFAADHQVTALTHAALDITDREALTGFIGRARPDVELVLQRSRRSGHAAAG